MLDIIVGLLAGLLGGIASGLLGVGGGSVFVPAMVVLLDEPQHRAQGISLGVIVVTAVSGSLVNLRRGNVELRAARWTVPSAMAFGFAGALAATALDAAVLRRVFGLATLAMAAHMLVSSWRGSRQPQARVIGGE